MGRLIYGNIVEFEAEIWLETLLNIVIAIPKWRLQQFTKNMEVLDLKSF